MKLYIVVLFTQGMPAGIHTYHRNLGDALDHLARAINRDSVDGVELHEATPERLFTYTNPVRPPE